MVRREIERPVIVCGQASAEVGTAVVNPLALPAGVTTAYGKDCFARTAEEPH